MNLPSASVRRCGAHFWPQALLEGAGTAARGKERGAVSRGGEGKGSGGKGVIAGERARKLAAGPRARPSCLSIPRFGHPSPARLRSENLPKSRVERVSALLASWRASSHTAAANDSSFHGSLSYKVRRLPFHDVVVLPPCLAIWCNRITGSRRVGFAISSFSFA